MRCGSRKGEERKEDLQTEGTRKVEETVVCEDFWGAQPRDDHLSIFDHIMISSASAPSRILNPESRQFQICGERTCIPQHTREDEENQIK